MAEKNIKGIASQMGRINATLTSYTVLVVILVVCMVIGSLAGLWMHSKAMAELSSRVYIIENGAALSAVAQESGITRRDEVEHHVRSFHELMFNIPPSTEMIKRNVERALEMADRSAYRYYNDLQESGFYRRLTATNSYMQVEITSVEMDMNTYPYVVVVRGYQYINRESNVSQYSLITTCRVAHSVRSRNNLHGLMIENFEVLENKLIEQRNKK